MKIISILLAIILLLFSLALGTFVTYWLGRLIIFAFSLDIRWNYLMAFTISLVLTMLSSLFRK